MKTFGHMALTVIRLAQQAGHIGAIGLWTLSVVFLQMQFAWAYRQSLFFALLPLLNRQIIFDFTGHKRS